MLMRIAEHRHIRIQAIVGHRIQGIYSAIMITSQSIHRNRIIFVGSKELRRILARFAMIINNIAEMKQKPWSFLAIGPILYLPGHRLRPLRSEERRVGQERVSTGRSRRMPDPKKNTKNK